MATDFELLERWRQGDRQAGNEVFQRHFEGINRFFESKLDDDVDDLIQATFLALVKGAQQFRGESSFRTYLYTIAKHELYRYLRKRCRGGAIDFGVTSVEDLGTTSSSRLIRNERKHLLLLALRSLALEQQMLLELFYWEELGLEAIASILEINPGAARTRLFRARRALRDRMAELAKQARRDDEGEDSLEDWARSLRETWLAKND